jgi:ParB family chromosome partitioning protein
MNYPKTDLHQLELKYSHIRISNIKRINRLALSISRHGQLEPLLTVAHKNKFILIDGYQRYNALRQIGRDTADIITVEMTEEESLLQLLNHRGERQWEAIEEAGIIQELHHRFNYSFSEIGKFTGRDKSYVKRRLDLLESLPEEILKRVLSGTISTWSANRILVPLARANAEDATKLAAHLDKSPLSTRELKSFYDHYQRSNRQVRKRMIKSPDMFIKTSAISSGKGGPEETWLRDAGAVCGILGRLQKKTAVVFYPNQEKKLRRKLLREAARSRRLTLSLHESIKEQLQND